MGPTVAQVSTTRFVVCAVLSMKSSLVGLSLLIPTPTFFDGLDVSTTERYRRSSSNLKSTPSLSKFAESSGPLILPNSRPILTP